MKTAFLSLVTILSLVSCKKSPSAKAEISNSSPKAGEIIEIKNLSTNGDVSYIKMKGDGIFNNKVFVDADFMATQGRFYFAYSKPGNYEVEVVTQSSDFLSGTRQSSVNYKIAVDGSVHNLGIAYAQ